MSALKLADGTRCTGCSACHDACRRNAIAMEMDREGFVYPRIDRTRCVGCGACRAVCPVLPERRPRPWLRSLAVRAKDSVRISSSSGGVFALLATPVVRAGGVAYGAAFSPDFSVVHVRAETEAELQALRQSKYVQSRTEGIYRDVRNVLSEGRSVVFSGTPCQVAGLFKFLGGGHEHLLTMDLICHGVPSPLSWQRYLESRRNRRRQAGEDDRLKSVEFRTKPTRGRFKMRLSFEDGWEIVDDQDPYHLAFACELFMRPACHACKFRGAWSGADITAGDFRGSASVDAELVDGYGTSTVLINTPAGHAAIEKELGSCKWIPLSEKDVNRSNAELTDNFQPSERRWEFMRRMPTEDFQKLVRELLYKKPNRKQRFAAWLHKMGVIP